MTGGHLIENECKAESTQNRFFLHYFHSALSDQLSLINTDTLFDGRYRQV